MTDSANFLLYPRLSAGVGRAIAAKMAAMDLTQIEAEGRLSHPQAAPSAIGGKPAPRTKIASIQEVVRGVAVDFGYPRRMNIAKQAEFDRVCGTLLLREMQIVPADAGQKDVWTFLSMIVLPEIAPWRFVDRSHERLLGGVRNVFQRLWWRAWALGPDLTDTPEGCPPFGEDEYVQIMERTSLAGNRRIALGIQTVTRESDPLNPEMQRGLLLREHVKRVRAVKSHISLDSLSDDQLLTILRETKSAAKASLASVTAGTGSSAI